MTATNDTRDANIALATKLLKDFGLNMEHWYDYLHDEIVMEFPFGASVGMPVRVEGKTNCSAMFATVCAAVQVKFSDIVVHPLLDPNRLIVEYKGHSNPAGKSYDQTYICIQEFRDGKLTLFKEFWNAIVVRDTFGDLSALGS